MILVRICLLILLVAWLRIVSSRPEPFWMWL